LAAEIKRSKGIDAKLEKGSGGIFDVYSDEKLIFSKHAENRFPESDEILAEL
jgi:predicted Rdx family selenoprotein